MTRKESSAAWRFARSDNRRDQHFVSAPQRERLFFSNVFRVIIINRHSFAARANNRPRCLPYFGTALSLSFSLSLSLSPSLSPPHDAREFSARIARLRAIAARCADVPTKIPIIIEARESGSNARLAHRALSPSVKLCVSLRPIPRVHRMCSRVYGAHVARPFSLFLSFSADQPALKNVLPFCVNLHPAAVSSRVHTLPLPPPRGATWQI